MRQRNTQNTRAAALASASLKTRSGRHEYAPRDNSFTGDRRRESSPSRMSPARTGELLLD